MYNTECEILTEVRSEKKQKLLKRVVKSRWKRKRNKQNSQTFPKKDRQSEEQACRGRDGLCDL